MLTTWGAGGTTASALVRGDTASLPAPPLPIGRAQGFSRLPPGNLGKSRVILIRHGQTGFNRVFSITRRDPGVRDPHLTDQGRRQAQAVARVSASFNLARLITSSLCARTRNRRDHSRASQRSDYGGPIDCRTLLVHLRHRLTLGRASCRVAGSGIRPSARSMVAPGGGNGGDDLASVPELPSTDGQ